MESSQGVGEKEECNSSESGWTKYIASPMQGIDDDGDNDGNGEDEGSDSGGDDGGDGGTSDSEDSMASDASSGPAHLDTSYSNAHTSVGGFKQQEEEESEEEEDGDDMDDGEDVGSATNYNGRAFVEKKVPRKRH